MGPTSKIPGKKLNHMTMTFDEVIAASIFAVCCMYFVFVFITTGTFKKKRP